MDNPNLKLSIEKQEKFEFYFIALVFTILGLSIQTSNLIKENCQYIFEIIGWVLLMISGLTGLSRLEWIPVIYAHIAKIQREEGRKNMFEKAYYRKIPLTDEYGNFWEERELQKELNETRQILEERRKKQNNLEKNALIKYKIHRLAFYLGLIFLMTSRIIYSLTNLFMQK